MTPDPSTPRSLLTSEATFCSAAAGGSLSHSTSTIRSSGTMLGRSTASSLSRVRDLRLPTSPSGSSMPSRTTLNGPARRSSTGDESSLLIALLTAGQQPGQEAGLGLLARAPPGGAPADRAVHHLGAAAGAAPAGPPGCDDLAGVGPAALGRRGFQHRSHRAGQAVDIPAPRPADRGGGRDLGLPQDLVGQQVPDPGDLGLIQQACLDRDGPVADQTADLRRRYVPGVPAEPGEIGIEQDAAEAALVEQRQPAAVGDLHREPGP